MPNVEINAGDGEERVGVDRQDHAPEPQLRRAATREGGTQGDGAEDREDREDRTEDVGRHVAQQIAGAAHEHCPALRVGCLVPLRLQRSVPDEEAVDREPKQAYAGPGRVWRRLQHGTPLCVRRTHPA
ncbi:hypothetical protein GCM10012320_17680 [Sinomonas cellulolyticus]|nr:hypothetical protein GCM10012320_17680 [Sinomonas sp. KCTC 49339]